MRKSILSFVIIIFIVVIALVVGIEWFVLNNNQHNFGFFVLNNIPKFNGEFVKVLNIALIKPTFTAAAYHQSFYSFYFLYSSLPPHARKNITSDLNLLSSEVTNRTTGSSSAFSIDYLTKHLKTSKSNITVLTDADADNVNSLFFTNGTSKYDILILGHQEYVTQQEYDNLKHFVSNGGTLVLMDGNVFIAQVIYDRNTHTITLVKGHGWAYNGKSAWKSVGERWRNETSQWIGSNSFCFSCYVTFANNPFQYRHHEEQYLTNPNDLILLNYHASTSIKQPKIGVATYELNYQKGKVIALGIYSDDIIANGEFDKYFDSLLVKYAPRK
jgi:hypothetical protein